MKTIVIDTNAYVHLLTGDENVLNALAKADIAYMSIFVLGELYAGFKSGNKEIENMQILSNFLSKPTVRHLDATTETASVFGHLKNSLKIAGTPLPINDIWIASHAIETGSVVITYDTHFQKISGLRLWEFI